jgi:hypothetical protein
MINNTIIPNELKITINTSVPGFQTIKYNPNMTIKDTDKTKEKKAVYFNPLVKLDKSVIESVPKDLRIKEFFNKGLFDSLIHSHGMMKEKTLKEAVNKGYVDHNIKVTLDTIFPTGSIIYINKEPYVITDIQWSTGDWKVDTKEKPVEFETSEITNPKLYANIIKDEIISGEKQLQELPPELISGPNYTGPQILPVASGLNNATPATIPPPTIPPSSETPKQIAVVSQSTELVPAKSKDIQLPPKKIIALPPAVPQSTELVPAKPKDTQLPPKQILALPPSVEPESMKSENKVEVIEEIPTPISAPMERIQIERAPECLLDYPRGAYESTTVLRKLFSHDNFYYLVNTIFLHMNEDTKIIIRDYLRNSTTISIDYKAVSLSKAAYKELIKGLRIARNEGAGDCFFLAVANAINCYNYKYPGNVITSGTYGKGKMIFTQLYLRNLVYNYLIQDKEQLQNMFETVIVEIEDLNKKFLQELTERGYGTQEFSLSNDSYLELMNNTYKSLPNFLVKKTSDVSDDPNVFTSPFSAIDKNNMNELKQYILSPDYWANEIAIDALCHQLKLNIITIKNDEGRFSIPFGNLLTTDNCNNWNKYLFLYNSNNHYELITFTYTTKIPSNNPRNPTGFIGSSETHVLFNNKYEILPPIFILFFIYGAKYVSIENENLNAKLLPNIFDSINNSLETILSEKNENTIHFFKIFNSYFPSRKISNLLNEIETEYNFKGGQKYIVLNPSYSKKIIKNEDKKDSSKICYYITIDMELQKGTTLDEAEAKNAKCRQKWNAVRKAYANFTGKKYIIPPVYDSSKNKTQKQSKNTSENMNSTKNNKPEINNGTRKYNSRELYKGGKHNRTIKKN